MISLILISLNPRGRAIIPQIIPTAVIILNVNNSSFKKPANANVAINERNPSTNRTDFIGFSFGFSFIFGIIIVSIDNFSLLIILQLFNIYSYANVNDEELMYKTLYIYSRTRMYHDTVFCDAVRFYFF